MNKLLSNRAIAIFEQVLAMNENASWEQFEQSCNQDMDLQAAVRGLYGADQAFAGNSEKTIDERVVPSHAVC